MAKQPSEIDADRNLLHRVIQTIRDESKAVTISGIALICAVLALLLSGMASNNSIEARLRAEYQDEKIIELRERVDYWTAHAQALRAELKARGFRFGETPTESVSPAQQMLEDLTREAQLLADLESKQKQEGE